MRLPTQLWYGSGFERGSGIYETVPSIEGDWFGSWVGTGDANVGVWHSPIFLAPSRIGVRLSGYPSNPGNKLYLRRLVDGVRIEIKAINVRERWADVWFDTPKTWRGTAVQLVAIDDRVEIMGWFAVQILETKQPPRYPAAVFAGVAMLLMSFLVGFKLESLSKFGGWFYRELILLGHVFAASTWIRKRWWCVVTVALLLRKPQAFLSPFLWAEDATVFLQQHFDKGLGALVTPYVGYLHSYIRLWVLPVQWLKFEWIPTYFMLAGVVPVILSTMYLCSDRFEWPKSGLFALAIPLAPIGGECLLNLVNSQWFVALWPLLVLLARPAATRRDRWIDGAMVVTAGLTGPFCVFYLPIFWVKTLDTPTRGMRAMTALLTATAAAQICGLIFDSEPAKMTLVDALVSWSSVAAIIGKRLIVSLLLGSRLSIQMPNDLALAITLAALVALTMVSAQQRDRNWSLLLWAAIGLSTAGVLRSGIEPFLRDPEGLFGERYFNVPRTILVWGVLNLAWATDTPRLRRVLIGTLTVILLNLLVSFGIPPEIDKDPWRGAKSCALSQRECVIDAAPGGWFYRAKSGWHRY
jgi:hypothetical protein